MGMLNSLQALDRRVLGAGSPQARRERRRLLADARAGRPVDIELVQQNRHWAERALSPQYRRKRLGVTAALAGSVLAALVLVTALTSADVMGGAGGPIGGFLGQILALLRERDEAREVLQVLEPGVAPGLSARP